MTLKNYNIIRLREVESTNSYAKKLLQDGKPDEGSMIIADFQTAGKGQDKNSWESEAGKNILASLILYPDFLYVAMQFSLSMSISLGIIDFLEEYLPDEDIHIKWPNDIYARNKKIGGILIQNEVMGNSFQHSIAGIGLNVNQAQFQSDPPNPVSLSMITGKTYSLLEASERLHACLMKRYQQLKLILFDQLRAEYHDKLLGMQEWRKYTYLGKQIKAKITGITEFGRLLLETESGKIECDLKEIAFIV